MFNVKGFILAAAITVSLLSASAAGAADKLPVVVSFSILGDIVAQVGGDRIVVGTLVGPDQDAHVYQPTPDDIKQVARARLIIVNGLGFEGWLERTAHAAAYKGAIVVASDGIALREMTEASAAGHSHHHDHDHSHAHAGLHADPHAWQDPQNVIAYVGNIASALSKLDPAGAAIYKKNGDAYIASLKQLDGWIAAQFAVIPTAKRRIITSHDAFGYFGARYHLTFIAPQGVSTDSEPGAKDVAAMIRQMKKEQIKAVFIENMSSPKLLEQIGREAGVAPGGKLYSDALSGAQGAAPDYLSMMRYNAGQMLTGLRKN